MNIKKTILLFSRSDLVYLYGGLHKYISNEFNVIHVAYSKFEANILEVQYGIKNFILFKDKFKEKKNIQFEKPFYEMLDEMFISYSNDRFNLNGSIISDRTFKKLTYEESLKITSIYYLVWDEILSNQKVDFFIHEPTSLMMNHMASILCKKYNCIYSTHIQCAGENKYDFIMLDHDQGYPTELISHYNNITDKDLNFENERINNFLLIYRSKYDVFFNIIGSKQNISYYSSLLIEIVKEAIISKRSIKLDPIDDNIDFFLAKDKPIIKKVINIVKYKKIKYDNFLPNDIFYFYPLHLEPEAVVLYWADGIYSNQVKLIENIASQLPVGVFLYVKDHPHLYGYRDVIDYERLKDIPNVKLIAPKIPGKEIIKYSKGVITLNGTAGFEALLLNKHVITFGKPFYHISSRVYFVKNIKDLRGVLYEIEDMKFEDDDYLYRFVLAYLRSLKPGFPELYFGLIDKIKLDKEDDIKLIASGLTSFFNKYVSQS